MYEAGGSEAWQVARAVCIAVAVELLRRGGRVVVARVFLHYKPKIETSERFEKVWIGNMNAAVVVVPTWCFQVLLNTVMANISGEVTSSICCTAAKLERHPRSGGGNLFIKLHFALLHLILAFSKTFETGCRLIQ